MGIRVLWALALSVQGCASGTLRRLHHKLRAAQVADQRLQGGPIKAFGHDHLVSANMISGCLLFNEKTLVDSSVDLIVHAASLRVIDPGESDEDRRQVQNTMAGKDVLDAEKYPEIRFTSTRVRQKNKIGGHWEIILEGILTIHGVEKSISLQLQLSAKDSELRAEGEVSFLQTDFGITPIKVGEGAVKVKNRVRIHFDVVADKSRL